jgi:hypothetical protein
MLSVPHAHSTEFVGPGVEPAATCGHDGPLGCRPPIEAMTVPILSLRWTTGAAPRRVVARRIARRAGLLLIIIGFAAAAGVGFSATDGIRSKNVSEHRVFTDAEIAEGFFKIIFGAEFHTGPSVDRVRRYDGPVRVFIVDSGRSERRHQLEQVIDDIRDRVSGLDIGVTQDRSTANILVSLVRDRDLASTISSVYGRDRARKIESTLEPQCLSGFRKDDSFRIVHSDVILVVDAGDFVFVDCAYEEMLQALGPINDDSSVPWTMFNDDVQLGFFGLYDQYLLNILYHPRIHPGMTRDEARAVLPEVLPDVRAFVAKKNGFGN